MIFSLIQDFADVLAAMPRDHPRRRILKLLDEAIRRDVHFIDRHPTTFFQCMWNTCWWYDCADAWRHGPYPTIDFAVRRIRKFWHAIVARAKDTAEPVKLFELLDRWRARKKEQTPGFCWLRSLRPPPTALDGRRRSLAGHEKYVKSVDTSPDGTRVISIGNETWIGVWDMDTGRLRARKYMGVRAVSSAAFSPDGTWFGGLSYNDRVTVAWKTKSLWETHVPQVELERVVFGEDYCPNQFLVEEDELGTTIMSDAGIRMAWLANLKSLQSDKDGNVWAGYFENYVGIFHLEGRR